MAIKNQAHAWQYIFNSLGLNIKNNKKINSDDLVRPDS